MMILLVQEELSILKRQNVSRSLSFGSTTIDRMQEQYSDYLDDTYETEKQQGEDLLGYESEGVVRMSAKQVLKVMLQL